MSAAADIVVGGCRILPGDCRRRLADLPDDGVHCCVTSPPYHSLRNYDHPDQIGQEANIEEYVTELVGVFREVKRVLRIDATLWLNLGDRFIDKQLVGMPWRVAFALRADGWYLRSDILWNKVNCMPESVEDRPTRAHEYVFLLSKSQRYFYDAEAVKEDAIGKNDHDLTGGKYAPPGQQPHTGSRKALHGPTYSRHRSSVPGGQDLRRAPDGRRNLRTVWSIPTQPYLDAHHAVMAPALAERCIRAGTSERGCCPACGAPWERVVEKGALVSSDGRTGSCGVYDQAGKGTSVSRTKADLGTQASYYALARRERREAGWRPTCPCDAGEPVPCTVLDPFAGAATTLLVADRLQRRSVGIELNPAYVEMAARRLRNDAPLFAEAVA